MMSVGASTPAASRSREIARQPGAALARLRRNRRGHDRKRERRSENDPPDDRTQRTVVWVMGTPPTLNSQGAQTQGTVRATLIHRRWTLLDKAVRKNTNELFGSEWLRARTGFDYDRRSLTARLAAGYSQHVGLSASDDQCWVAHTRGKRPEIRAFGDRPSNWPVGAASGHHLQSAVLARSCVLAALVRGVPAVRSAAAAGARRRRPARGGELVASIRSEPSTYNRYVAGGAARRPTSSRLLTQARLVRVNRATDELEPWLAEGWTPRADGLTYTVTLATGVRVLRRRAAHVRRRALFVSRRVRPGRQQPARARRSTSTASRSTVAAPDARTVVVRFPEPFAPGLRRARQPADPAQAQARAGARRRRSSQNAWSPSKPLTDVVGLGPFMLDRARRRAAAGLRAQPALLPARRGRRPAAVSRSPDAGHRARSEHRGAAARGGRDRPDEQRRHPPAGPRGLQAAGGPGPAADDGGERRARPRLPVVQPAAGAAGRAAGAVDRRAGSSGRRSRAASIAQAIVNTVYLGAAVPLYGPVTPGNRRWHSAAAPACAARSRRSARQLLATAGLTRSQRRRHARGRAPAARRGSRSSRRPATCASASSSVLQEQLRQLGIAVDIVPLDPRGLLQRWTGGRLRRDLLRAAGELDRSGAEPGLLAQLGAVSFLEPEAGDPRDAVGAAHRRADARAGDGRRPRRAPARVRRGAADLRRGAAVDLLRRAARHARDLRRASATPTPRAAGVRTFSGARTRWRSRAGSRDNARPAAFEPKTPSCTAGSCATWSAACCSRCSSCSSSRRRR